MDVKRKAASGIVVLAVALAAGHLVQSMGNKPAPRPVASADLTNKPAKVETVAAGPEAAAAASVTKPADSTAPLPAAPLAATVPEATLPPAPQVKVEVRKASPASATPEVSTATACDVSLDLMTEPNAMIGVTLVAPCYPGQRVVLQHGGLAVTGQTTSTGALFTALPALESQSVVEVAFADGTKARGELAMPELATLRRFGVQWQADDAFQLHAFEGEASYGGPGHVSAADPHLPPPGLEAKGGFLTQLGDATAPNPLLAEIYTFPADPAIRPEVVVEAAVTDKTCGRELLAETLTSTGGTVFVTDLTLAMPQCDAVGDYLVLKNLVLDLNMAAAN
ncbi:hypothetical protein [Tabrizicola oligotrophica]|uniref:Translocase n=1 Tax=Tabrizicola oligotrophica TaxID=2710650 RepID=A0A6M0QR89_9RHOB|nr:hypothetical protein [Tabrizicola oligotrophica]NEY90030.1 hypothetical protein [Tabrizicola oligotrophica]